MHDVSMVQSFINTALEFAVKHEMREITEIVAHIGVLNLVHEDNIVHNFDMLKQEYPVLSGAKITINWIHGEVKCASCGHQGEVPEDQLPKEHLHNVLPFLSCTECGSKEISITAGHDVYIDKIDYNK